MKHWKRLTALLLALALMLSLTANAADTDIVIPDGWAHDALAFCVDNGILTGNAKGDLMPKEKAQRAQLAAMLSRLFRAQTVADLSGYTDVSETDWFYTELSRAVAMGLFEGSGGKLNPRKAITREQAFTVLARAFGVTSENIGLINDFSDGYLVSDWAKPMVAGLIEAGYVHGNSDGSLNPKGQITRQELAQVLYNALACITEDAEALDGSKILYYGNLEDLQGKTVSGDLILSSEVQGDVALDGFRVEGRLVLQLRGADAVTVGAVAENITVAMPAEVTFTEAQPNVVCTRDGAALRGNMGQAVVSADCTLHGNYDTVVCCGGTPTLGEDCTVESLTVPALFANGSIAINGQVTEVHCYGRKTALTGIGSVKKAYVYASGFTADCQIEASEDRVDYGLEGATLVLGNTPNAYYDADAVTVLATLQGMDTAHTYGVENGVRKGTVSFYYQGTLLSTRKDVELKNGLELQCTFNPKVVYGREETQNVQAVIRYGTDIVVFALPVHSTGRYTPDREAKTIRTCHVIATILYTTSMYTTSSCSTYRTTLAAGTQVYFLKYLEDNGPVCWVETKEGVRGWVANGAVRVSWTTYHSDTVSYSTEAKEYFVNSLHDYASSSSYLIWVNLYSTTVNIFEGSKGEWKLIKSCECVIGTPGTPTRPGVYSVYSHNAFWSFDSNGVLDVSRCYYCTLFDGGIAFHTRLKYTSNGSYVSSALSAELSHGCVRCPDDIARFIYYQVPTGSTVVVY